MNVSIKGKILKDNGSWRIQIGILEYPVICNRPLLCFKEVEKAMRIELQDENLQCFFKVDDHGVFYLLMTQTPELIKYISSKLVDLSDFSIDPDLAEM